MENTLNNPITRAKIELICGSVEAFLKNPNLLQGHESENTNFKWMRVVTPEEAERSLKCWNEWAAKPVDERMPKGKGTGEWLYEKEASEVETKPQRRFQYVGPYNSYAEHIAAVEEMNRIEHEKQYGLKDSLTPGAKQVEWKRQRNFLRHLRKFQRRLFKTIFHGSQKAQYIAEISIPTLQFMLLLCSEDQSHLAVLTEISGVTNYALSEVTYENGYFIHKSIRTFFTEDGANKYYTYSLGKEWNGGDVMEDFC